MEAAVNNGMCRCCASEGTFKDMKTTYHWMGDEEIYSDMLQECFDITLTMSQDGANGGICEVCITQLRNAANFKKQVQHTEEQFISQLEGKVFKGNVVKIEPSRDDDDELEADGGNTSDFSDPEYELPIKKEEVEEPKPKKRAAATRASTARAKKAKAEEGEPSTKRTREKKPTKPSKSKPTNVVKKTKLIKVKSIDKIVKIELKRRSEVNKHLDNIRTILLNSNATPIRCKGGMGYACCFCTNQYPDPKDLKTHTIESHDDKVKSAFMKGYSMPTYIVKLDVSWLNCNICDSNFDVLDNLIDHLIERHNKPYNKDVKSHIVPFKFEKDNLHCTMCSNEFNNFKVLLEHMNLHYRNHICEVCGCGFVNRRILQTHSYRHKTGVFNCSFCSKLFDTRVKMKEHERAVHICMNKRNKCGYCGEKFTDYTKKNDHEVKVHGAKAVVLKCQACNKVFDNQRALTVHTKAYHMMERRMPK